MSEVLGFLKDNYVEILEALVLLNVAAAAVAKLTPSAKDDGAVAKVKKVLDYLSLSVRK